MNLFDPVLDRPETLDLFEGDETARFLLANHDLLLHSNERADLRDLRWPWVDELYAKQIDVHIFDLRDDEFTPMIVQRYPGYVETIYGTDGMIVSKRLIAPFQSAYDRAVIWQLACQAEGDRVLRIEVEIDWGEPLSQRMVDGLLVAQRNPGAARGLYKQQNAESTRVFGNPQGRPERVDLTDPRRARLVYYVLVNGIVEVSMTLAVSDAGEQMAWGGFLALRDSERIFNKSNRAWRETLSSGQLWTPDPRINRARQDRRIAAVQNVQRLPAGMAPAGREIGEIPDLVAAYDEFDPVMSRNLLAHLRRVVERTAGSLPAKLPRRAKEAILPPGPEEAARAGLAYLQALSLHLAHHPDQEVAAEHYPAVDLLAQKGIRMPNLFSSRAEIRDNQPQATLDRQAIPEPGHDDVWRVCGLYWQDGRLHLDPISWNWDWWALLSLPRLVDEQISLVWDGAMLHTTYPLETNAPVMHWARIDLLYIDESDFRPTIRFVDADGGETFFVLSFLDVDG